MGRNFWAPIEQTFAADSQLPTNEKPLRRVLDVGCGTAIWGFEVLQQLLQAGLKPQVINLDIDAVLIKHYLTKLLRKRAIKPDEFRTIQPDGMPPPDRPHFLFMKANATKRFPFEDGTFDFTHARIPDPFLSEEGWPWFIREMMRVTKTDGWVELLAADWYYMSQPSEALQSLRRAAEQLAGLMKLAPLGGPKLPLYLQQAGISVPILKHSLGNTRRQRLIFLRDMLHVERHVRTAIIRAGILSYDEFDQLLAQFEQDAPKYGLYQTLYRLFFQPKDQLALGADRQGTNIK